METEALRNVGVSICGGFGPQNFHETNKSSLTILGRLMTKIIAYLDDLLLIGQTREEAIQDWDSVIFLLIN